MQEMGTPVQASAAQHSSQLLTCQELELGGAFYELLSVFVCTCQDHTQVIIYKGLRVLLGSTKVDEMQLISVLIIQEVAPVGVGLHEAPVEKLPDGQAQQ